MTITPREAIAIGASSGAVEAVSAILTRLPEDYPLPIFVVVHVPPDRPSALVDVFQAKSPLNIREAEDKEPIEPSCVYLAPPDYHLMIETEKLISLSSEEPVHYSRPAIDVLFETAADAYGAGLIGIVLTGSNDDGSAGLRCISQLGGATIVQCPNEAASPFMPNSAKAACPEARTMNLEEIAEYLLNQGRTYD
ncbi:chemotaxis protein CheB [Blastopirellula marina]|uniref:protein-glutamate methylesterase n=1 Tax=Blastopirellula marina DSM 3645 TaxID=314230 RepID=A4A0F6_9BACT|nr:chemotaxis protein CheB [Blastopirellula marina]EAQ77776.1 chemotaxis response regulator protein-glutamate methylesterase [Blastopirellula marina DSM 3645]